LKNRLFIQHKRILLFSFILLFAFTKTAAQETVVVGQVLNSADNSPIPSVSVYFKNTEIGANCNEEGLFLIRTTGKETTLVFSSVGYKRQEIKIKRGQSVGVEVKLIEENTLLQDVLVLPGTNPAIELMKKVRFLKSENDVSKKGGFNAQSTEQNLVLLSKISQRSINKRLFEQLKSGSLNHDDSLLIVPLYMAENGYKISAKEKKQISEKVFSSNGIGKALISQLVGETDIELNFYENSITLFGKSIVSPLSSIGNAYYDFYIADSLHTETGKQYEIHFRTKNSKNLAFDGQLWIDSLSFALTRIDVQLPNQANINFIHNLRISQRFTAMPNNRWTPSFDELTLNMTYQLLADSLRPNPEIFIKQTATYNYTDSIQNNVDNFAKSKYSEATLNEKLNELNDTPLLRTAKWLGKIILTGYIPMGKFDLGKIQQLARITDIEGFRMNLPFRTNENLWKNISVGGYAGYGFKSKEFKYSGGVQFRLPGEKRRIVGVNYCDDYRVINYDYNNFIYYENPLVTGDVDIANTIIGFNSAERLNGRKEFTLSFTNDWSSDIESNLFIRSNQIFSNEFLPMTNGSENIYSLQQQSATLLTRFSFDERTYNDHLKRIYISNHKPVFYSTLEAGKYNYGSNTGNYGKLTAAVKQFVRTDIGQFNYVAEAGWIFGNVPYPLLHIPFGKDTGGYSLYAFNAMKLMEYATDKYITVHSEFISNGFIFNQIPIIKKLNLREMCSMHFAYGGLSDKHQNLMQFPDYLKPLNKPYMEVGVGVSNILHLFTVQSVWRLSDLQKPGVIPWLITTSISLSF